MANGKSSTPVDSSNKSGKMGKQNPGEPVLRNNGKTVDGYSPSKIAQRKSRRLGQERIRSLGERI